MQDLDGLYKSGQKGERVVSGFTGSILFCISRAVLIDCEWRVYGGAEHLARKPRSV